MKRKSKTNIFNMYFSVELYMLLQIVNTGLEKCFLFHSHLTTALNYEKKNFFLEFLETAHYIQSVITILTP